MIDEEMLMNNMSCVIITSGHLSIYLSANIMYEKYQV